MAGKLNFDESLFTSDYTKIESNLKDMENNLINVLQEFIMEMPEFKSIRSNFTKTTDFWKSLSKDGTTTLPDMDNLINYISDNYNEGIEGKTEELVEKLEAEREACVKVCKEAGEELIKKQQEVVEQNQQIIQEEKEKLAILEQEVEELKSKKIDLEGELLKYSTGDPKIVEIQSDIDACEEHIYAKEDVINLLTTRPRLNK